MLATVLARKLFTGALAYGDTDVVTHLNNSVIIMAEAARVSQGDERVYIEKLYTELVFILKHIESYGLESATRHYTVTV